MEATYDAGLAMMEPSWRERRRTIVALVSASIISVVVWGLVVVLHVH